MKLSVLAIAAHPDDIELACSGTLVRLAQQGYPVGILDLTRGELGSRGTPEGRLQEAAEAARILRLTARENLGLADGGLENTPEYRAAIIARIRYYQPDICLINAPFDRHPDHGNAARLTIDALFYSGLSKIETFDLDGCPQQAWRPYHILHYMQDRPFDPDIVVDISEVMDLKEQAILAFSSQFNVEPTEGELTTYISRPDFFQSIRARARHYGHLGGCTYGEPFLYYNKPIPVQDPGLFFQSKPHR